jgi:hypothetical protein
MVSLALAISAGNHIEDSWEVKASSYNCVLCEDSWPAEPRSDRSLYPHY